MVAWLDWLVAEWRVDRAWVDVSEAPVRGGDYAKLRYWRLVEQKPATDDAPAGASRSGLWRPTPRGRKFAAGKIQVPTHVFVLRGRLIGRSDTTCTIDEAARRRFHVKDLTDPGTT